MQNSQSDANTTSDLVSKIHNSAMLKAQIQLAAAQQDYQLAATLQKKLQDYQSLYEQQKEVKSNDDYQSLIALYALPTSHYQLEKTGTEQHRQVAEKYQLQKRGYGTQLGKLKNAQIAKIYAQHRHLYKEPWRAVASVGTALSSVEKTIKDAIMKDVMQLSSAQQSAIPHKERILHFLKTLYENIDITEEDITINTERGKNEGYVVNIQGKKHFIKTCGGQASLGLDNDGRINPNELLLYKTLEYMHYGPKTTILMQSYSALGGRTQIAHGNYIMTEAVPNFLVDKSDYQEEFDQFKNSHDKQDAVEISGASLVRDLLSLGDTFPANAGNYGISTQEGQGAKFMFIDHLPTANGFFATFNDDKKTNYSPRTHMQNLCSESASNFKDLSQNHQRWQKFALAKDVNNRIFKDGPHHLSIENALDRAKKDIESLIEKYEVNFIEQDDSTGSGKKISANQLLESHCQSIKDKIANYKETEYAKYGGVAI